MKFTLVSLAALASAENLEIVGSEAGWTQSGSTFTGAGAWTGRKTFLGKSSGGGMCASADAHFDTTLHLSESRYGELGSISMRADSKTGSTGYQCTLDTRKGQGVMLKRDGGKPNNCVHRDFSNGAPTRWDPSAAWRGNLDNQCFIRDRAWTMFDGATDYKLSMTIVENADQTATIECSVDGKLMAWYTDPCPLTGGEYGLATSRNTAKFDVTSFTDRSCNDVAVAAMEAPSLADGLTLNGIGQTGKFWKSTGGDSVTHYYSGACNSHGGKNREAGAGVYGRSSSYGARGDALNVASLTPSKCVKDGFIEADVTLVNDYLNGPSGQYGSGSNGNVGLLMRVQSDSDGKGHKMGVNYDSWGYLFQVDMTSGKIAVFRGNNGGDHNRNSISAAYLTGRYRCKNCKCKGSWDTCEQFSKPQIGSTHNMRLEIATTDKGYNHVKAYLNGTLVVDKIDQPNSRNQWAHGLSPSAETNMCGDFGLATYDSDVVAYKIKDYTGYVAVPVETPEPIAIELAIEGELTEAKEATIKSVIAAELGVDEADITITLGGKAARRRLAAAQLITVHVKVAASKAATITETLESPAFAEATGTTFVGVEVDADATGAFAESWNKEIVKKASKDALAELGVTADRYYSAAESRACCMNKCGSNNGCKKGCIHWIGHTSLNWIAKNQPKLRTQCKKHCTKAARGLITFTHTKVDAGEESACITGCDNYNKCW